MRPGALDVFTDSLGIRREWWRSHSGQALATQPAVVSCGDSDGARTNVPRQAIDVLRYFVRYPANTESLEGMARWRLAEESIHRSVDEIDEALRWLVAHGLLIERSSLGSQPTFSMNLDRIAQARDWLDSRAMEIRR